MAKLSTHFDESELTFTTHTDIDNTPAPFDYNGLTVDPVANLRVLCEKFLEPLRARFGPLHINSGYRSPALNAHIPGTAKDSAHSYGCAADIHPPDTTTVAEMVEWARHNLHDFDQIIDELRGDGAPWMHIGMLRPGHEPKARGQVMRMRVVDGKSTYTNI